MPFKPVDGMNFAEVTAGLRQFFEPVLFLLKHHPPVNGKTFDQYMDALVQMVGDASDKLYSSDDTHGQQLADLRQEHDQLKNDYSGTALVVAHLEEEIAVLRNQIKPSTKSKTKWWNWIWG